MRTLFPSIPLRLENVSKKFGERTVVSNVSFEVLPGEIMVLLGTSGSGKTTLLRMINRMYPRDGGQIYFDDKTIDETQGPVLRRKIGYVLQNFGLFPHFTVRRNIDIVPRITWGGPREDFTERINELMEKLHLPVSIYADKYPRELSGGQQQRVSLARALVSNPPILLMDEPFGSLDPVTRADIRKEVRTLDEVKSKTVIMVTHDVMEAVEMGHKICLMDQGVIQQLGTPTELLFKPANDFVRNFFKGQRLMLELKALTMDDLKPWLPPPPVRHNSQTPKFTERDTCWDALEASNADGIVFINYDNMKSFRGATTESLLNAVAEFKKQFNGESTHLS